MVLVMSARPVMAATTTITMSAIPTGAQSPVTIMNRAALHVEEDGHTYTDPDNDTILDSYGHEDRRTRTTPTSRIQSALLVSSATAAATTMSRIPTGANLRTRYTYMRLSI